VIDETAPFHRRTDQEFEAEREGDKTPEGEIANRTGAQRSNGENDRDAAREQANRVEDRR